ncbi:MAG: hypothetical protein GX916_03290 [Clostridiales bacterium]|nr:hypothetical protein [Clostridiales bacterium]
MICTRCKKESNSASRVCPYCGRYMGAEDAPPLPPQPVYAEQIVAEPEYAAGRRVKSHGKKPRRQRVKRVKRKPAKNYNRRMINWAMVALVVLILSVVLAAGGFVYLKVTPAGQLILARMGRDASADAYWALGTEYLDQGYIARSIDTYLKAEKLDPHRDDLADKLLLLAEAYEAGAQPEAALDIYTRIYQELEPESPLGYRHAVRLLLDQGFTFRAAELLQVAYEKTGDEAFYNQRSSMVPKPPTASLSGGRHLLVKTVAFESPQGYSIYYTTGDEVLPEDGTLYTEPITLHEGSYNFRAVCVSSELISDEMSVSYTIALPTPLAPKATLQQGEYKKKQRVRLRNMDEDEDITLYYTIDGTKPNLNSPRYKDEPIELGIGRVTLRAIAVNSYGKVSNELYVQYRISIPFGGRTYFRFEDGFEGLTMGTTTPEDFVARQGEPAQRGTVDDPDAGGEALRLVYPWGEARFTPAEGGTLYMIDTSAADMTGPRKTTVGMHLDEVTDKFRDMNQLPNDKGDRGIYYDIDQGSAAYTVYSDDPDNGELTYISTGTGPAGTTTVLRYEIEGRHVTRIKLTLVYKRLSLVQ